MGKKNGEETLAAEMPDEPVEYLAEEQGVGEKQPKKQPEDIGTVHYPYRVELRRYEIQETGD